MTTTANCPKTGRSASACDSPDHRNCPDLGAVADFRIGDRVQVYGRIWQVQAPYRRHGEVGTLHLRAPEGDDNFLVAYGSERLHRA